MESYQLYLNSKYAVKRNDEYHFEFNTPLDIEDENYIYLSVQNVMIPYSFYNINKNNNRLEYIVNNMLYTVNITEGNYNINQLINFLKNSMTSFIINYSSITNKLSFSLDVDDFIFISSSTCFKLIGFDENKIYYSSNKILNAPNCVNLLDINMIYILSNLMTYNICSSIQNSNRILCAVPINCAPNSIINYVNRNNFRTNLFVKSINSITIKLIDENNDLIDLNNLDFDIVLQIDIEGFK